MDDLISTAEAARLLGVSPRRVLALIAKGRLPARTIGAIPNHLIRRGDLDLVKVRKAGRPFGWKAPPKPAGKKPKPKPKGHKNAK